MNPIPAIRIGLLLSQGRLDKFFDPPGLHRCGIITVHWESLRLSSPWGWKSDPVVSARNGAVPCSHEEVPSPEAEPVLLFRLS